VSAERARDIGREAKSIVDFEHEASRPVPEAEPAKGQAA
jgi:hypothetical protein